MVRNLRGYTLVEVLITLAMTGIVLGSIYSTYLSHQQSYVTQQEVAVMQQNLRAAMHVMATELKMAGFDPTGDANAGIVSIAASPASVRFTADLNGNGDLLDADEDITYALYASGGVQKLGRKNPDVDAPVAENIEALDLVFLDGDNVPTTVIPDIRSVQITLVARSARQDPYYTSNVTYTNLQGSTVFGPAGDSIRRMVLAEQVKFRNLGL